MTITINEVEVELTFRAGVGVGQAVHCVSTSDLANGPSGGPSDGEEFEVDGKSYKLGSHDYDEQGDVTVCVAEIYEAEWNWNLVREDKDN